MSFLFHDGSVDDGLNVVLSVFGVDDPLPLGVLLHFLLVEELEAHVRRHRLKAKHKSSGFAKATLQAFRKGEFNMCI